MIAHQNIGMPRFNLDFVYFNFIKAVVKEDANKECSPPKEIRMKWFRFNNHNNKPANLVAKFGLIISWFSSKMIISEGVCFLKNAFPIAGR